MRGMDFKDASRSLGMQSDGVVDIPTLKKVKIILKNDPNGSKYRVPCIVWEVYTQMLVATRIRIDPALPAYQCIATLRSKP